MQFSAYTACMYTHRNTYVGCHHLWRNWPSQFCSMKAAITCGGIGLDSSVPCRLPSIVEELALTVLFHEGCHHLWRNWPWQFFSMKAAITCGGIGLDSCVSWRLPSLVEELALTVLFHAITSGQTSVGHKAWISTYQLGTVSGCQGQSECQAPPPFPHPLSSPPTPTHPHSSSSSSLFPG